LCVTGFKIDILIVLDIAVEIIISIANIHIEISFSVETSRDLSARGTII